MSKYEKLIQALKSNPKADWKIEDLKRIADRLGIDYRQPGTSHLTFSFQKTMKLTVPVRRPIKPFYIKKFIESVEIEEKENG